MSNTINSDRDTNTNTSTEQPPIQSHPLDIAKALKQRLINGLTYQEIADIHGKTKSTVHQALKPFMTLIKDPQTLSAFNSNKTKILDSMEMELLYNLADKKKLKAASTNNIAYALQQVHNINRLEKDLSTANVAQKLVFHVVRDQEQTPDVVVPAGGVSEDVDNPVINND